MKRLSWRRWNRNKVVESSESSERRPRESTRTGSTTPPAGASRESSSTRPLTVRHNRPTDRPFHPFEIGKWVLVAVERGFSYRSFTSLCREKQSTLFNHVYARGCTKMDHFLFTFCTAIHKIPFSQHSWAAFLIVAAVVKFVGYRIVVFYWCTEVAIYRHLL